VLPCYPQPCWSTSEQEVRPLLRSSSDRATSDRTRVALNRTAVYLVRKDFIQIAGLPRQYSFWRHPTDVFSNRSEILRRGDSDPTRAAPTVRKIEIDSRALSAVSRHPSHMSCHVLTNEDLQPPGDAQHLHPRGTPARHHRAVEQLQSRLHDTRI